MMRQQNFLCWSGVDWHLSDRTGSKETDSFGDETVKAIFEKYLK
jgi:hypothetical protein